MIDDSTVSQMSSVFSRLLSIVFLQVFKRLHLGTVSFGSDSMEEVRTYLRTMYDQSSDSAPAKKSGSKVS